MSMMNKLMNMFGLAEEEDVIEEEMVNEESTEPSPFERKKNKGNNVVSIHSQKNVKIVLYEPRSYDETQEIADQLCSRRSVVVNLQRVRSDQAVRIVDFLSGTVYALNGSITKVGPGIFLCTPDIVDIEGQITEVTGE